MKKKILVVEDDTFLMDAYTLKLSQTDFDVATANNGEEALKSCKSALPDLIILDIFMPKMDGIEFLKQFAKQFKDAHIPVIVATNNDQPDVAQQAMKLGAVDVFIKSDISIKDLVTKCNTHLTA